MFNSCNSGSEDEQDILWSQNFLGPKFTNFTTKSIKYMSLDTHLFIAGVLNNIRSNQIDPNDQRYRFDHLCDTLFNIGHYEWPAILKLHAAILTEINKTVILPENSGYLPTKMNDNEHFGLPKLVVEFF